MNYVIQKTTKSKPFICHIDRLRKFTGDIPRCWTADTANEVQPEVGNRGNSHPAYTTGRGPGPAVTLVTEDELSSGASAENVPALSVPRRDSTSARADLMGPVRADVERTGLRKSQSPRQLPRRYRD